MAAAMKNVDERGGEPRRFLALATGSRPRKARHADRGLL
jgi:hypothetical protein